MSKLFLLWSRRPAAGTTQPPHDVTQTAQPAGAMAMPVQANPTAPKWHHSQPIATSFRPALDITAKMSTTTIDRRWEKHLREPIGDELKYFLLFLPYDAVAQTVAATNQILHSEHHEELTVEEFLQFLGIWLLATGERHRQRRTLWSRSNTNGPLPISRNRFEQLVSLFRLQAYTDEDLKVRIGLAGEAPRHVFLMFDLFY